MIRLFYFKNNYGDDLSAYLVSRLSGEEVVSCTPLTLKRFLLDWMIRGRDLLFFKGFHNFSFSYARKSRILFAVGSIIGLGRSNCTIWGSGITYGNDPIDPAMDIRAVRGPLTRRRAAECGYAGAEKLPLGDPGLLLPLVYPNRRKKECPLGLIAHNNDFAEFRHLLRGREDTIRLISLQTRNRSVESITDQICSCERILSTSLHGLIVSHAYGIPALRIASGRIPGDGSKFSDYFLSVGLQPYPPIPMEELPGILESGVDSLFERYADVSLPQADPIQERQKALLESAPFPLLPEFMRLKDALK